MVRMRERVSVEMGFRMGTESGRNPPPRNYLKETL